MLSKSENSKDCLTHYKSNSNSNSSSPINSFLNTPPHSRPHSSILPSPASLTTNQRIDWYSLSLSLSLLIFIFFYQKAIFFVSFKALYVMDFCLFCEAYKEFFFLDIKKEYFLFHDSLLILLYLKLWC